MEIKHRTELNKLLPKNPVTVELGVAEGYFSAEILKNWKPRKHYMVDLWETQPQYPGDAGFDQGWHNKNHSDAVERTKNFTQAEILRGPTTQMQQYVKDSSVDMVYIDACHSLDCVRNDIRAWWPKLKPGGVMAFHDYESVDYGVKQAVHEFASQNGLTVKSIPEHKAEDAGAYFIKHK
jgi:hypothetical protein